MYLTTLSTSGLLADICASRLVGLSKLTRDEMRVLAYRDTLEIDVCGGI